MIDRGVEDRGVVLVDGKPDRLILERLDADGVERRWRRHDALTARVRTVSRGLGIAFLDAGADMPELTAPAAGLVEGARITAHVLAPARREKLGTARVLGPAASDLLGRCGTRPSVAERLRAVAPDVEIQTGPFAREAADAAQEEALQTEHALLGGARLFIEPTRALVAVDVDVGASAAGGDPKRRQRQANLAALRELPRLLRLKGLGGLVAIDLVGKGHDGETLAAAARSGFERVYGAEAAIGPISRFGVMQLRLPWTDTPLADLLLGPTGSPTPLTRAFALLRAIEREAGAGGRVEARCAPDVHAAAAPYLGTLADLIGARFTLQPDPAVSAASPLLIPR